MRDRAMPNMGGCRRTGRSSGWAAVTWQEWVALRPHPWPALAGVRLATAEHSPTLLGLRVTDTERTLSCSGRPAGARYQIRDAWRPDITSASDRIRVTRRPR